MKNNSFSSNVSSHIAVRDREQVLRQLRRISGQIDGVVRMYEAERPCIEIIRQITAVRSSLGRIARDVLTGEANRCSSEHRVEDLQEILKEAFRY